jgi:hypothetical protein
MTADSVSNVTNGASPAAVNGGDAPKKVFFGKCVPYFPH